MNKHDKKISDSFTVNRLDNVCFGVVSGSQKLSYFTEGIYVAKIVDDSNYVPNSNYIRTQLASGTAFTKGIYDFPDGKDNGFTPKLRSLDVDLSEVDQAVNETLQEAKDKVKSKNDSEASKKVQERQEKILNNLENLSNSSDNSDSNPSE